VVQPCAAQVAVLLLSVTVVLPCAVQAVMLRLAVTITVARITVADGGMVPVPSLLVWQSVPPLVPQPPHHIIIPAATRITVRHLTSFDMADDWRRGFGQSQMQQLRAGGSMRSVWIAFALTAIVTSSAFAGLDDVNAVIPGTFGVLTKCRGWVITTTCRTYHHMRLPHRIAVGDTIILNFGSNPKHYRFPVARIDQKAGRCVIFSEAEGHRRRIDKINVPHCHRAV
jgi:hypothetical protein